MAGLSRVQIITVMSKVAPAADWGAKPRLRWIQTDALLIDREYQRDILGAGINSIKRIVEHFRWARFGALLVSDRGDGRFAVVDGQHRTAAALFLEIPELPCYVITASLEEEAEAFAAINGGGTRLHALQVFHARVVAGDKSARRLMAVAKECGVVIPRHPGLISKPGETHAIGALIKAHQTHGDAVLGMALRAVVETGGGNVGLLKPAVIHGLCDALAMRAAWRRRSQAALNAVIETAKVERLLKTVERIRALDGGSARALFAALVGKVLDQS